MIFGGSPSIEHDTKGQCEHCGQPIRSIRNLKRHKLFFAMLRPVYANWPEHHAFKPMTLEHLRAWLLVQAGWCDVTEMTIKMFSPEFVMRVLQFFMSDVERQTVFYETHGKVVRKYVPKSISFKSCREVEFEEILQRVIVIAEATTGIMLGHDQ